MTIRPWYTDRSFRTSAEYSLAIAVGRQAVLWSDDPPRHRYGSEGSNVAVSGHTSK